METSKIRKLDRTGDVKMRIQHYEFGYSFAVFLLTQAHVLMKSDATGFTVSRAGLSGRMVHT